MKFRTGLVSNSSSSSFIVMMPSRPPMTVEEKKVWLEKHIGDNWQSYLGDNRCKKILEDDSIYLQMVDIEYEADVILNDLDAKDWFIVE